MSSGWILLACVPWLAGCSALPFAENPAARGFDAAHSDARAIEIADETMRAMGGRAAWDSVREIRWSFFGRRRHVWNKRSGDVRVDDGARVVEMNLWSGKGRVLEGGVEVEDEAARAAALEGARRAWINDSYWLVMPYKLKDAGVTLKDGGEARLPDGRLADVLVLTFQGVGVTPQNKYDVYVARDTRLVEQWSYYENAADAAPKLTTPWAGWKRYGPILLSGDRGDGRVLTEISVTSSRREPPDGSAP